MTKLTTLGFLISRFAWHSRESTIRAMVIICFISIALSSFALALVMAIMNGFEQETRAVIQGIHPDLVITAEGRPLAYEKIKQVIKQEFSSEIAGSAPHMQAHALIRADTKTGSETSIGSLGVLFGMDPAEEPSISSLDKMLLENTKSLQELLVNNNVIIGASLATALAVKKGDTLILLFAPESEQETADNITLEQKKVKIAGIFKTGVDDLDAHVIGLNNSLLNSFYPGIGITQIGIKLATKNQESFITAKLKKRLGLTVLSWYELYPALLAALTLEKYTMFLIVVLITLVASMNIISLLYMYITHKQSEIAIARTLGVTKQHLVFIFTAIGATIALTAALIGTILATITGWFLKHYVTIPLPEVYYVSHVPVHMTSSIIVIVIVLVLIISCIASYIPARKINTISLATILRNSR